jgi:hypothetical protein
VHSHPALLAGRPRFDIADIVREHRKELEAEVPLSLAQRRVLSAMELCRTAALGGHMDVCPCGYERPAYNSCRNRNCPKCQALDQEKWIAERSARLLPVGHFHAVFTLPSELRPLAKCLPAFVFNMLFEEASQTLLELGKTRLHAKLAFTMVLHTWTRELSFHPHVHAIVSAGGLRSDGTWKPSSDKYLFPFAVMRILLRGKVIAALRRAQAKGKLDACPDFKDPQAFERLMAHLAKMNWVVYAKRPFGRAEFVLRYLGRYTHRVGIANSRLFAVTHDAVTFGTKEGKSKTLKPVEFLRRFIQHVLPRGLQKIRHYGLYAGASSAALKTAHALLAPVSLPVTAPALPSWSEQLLALTGRDASRCPLCGGPLQRIAVARTIARPTARAPPLRIAA